MSDLTKGIFSGMQMVKDDVCSLKNKYAKLFYTETDSELAAVYELVRKMYWKIEINIRDHIAELKRSLEEGDNQ